MIIAYDNTKYGFIQIENLILAYMISFLTNYWKYNKVMLVKKGEKILCFVFIL